MTTAVILIVVLLTIAHFYLKCSVMSAFATLMSGIIASIFAYNYFEALADLLVSRGYAGQWAHCGCFILLFVLVLAVVQAINGLLTAVNVDFGPLAKNISNVVLGLATGLILAGHILVAIGMSPIASAWAYQRFTPGESISLQNQNVPVLNPDGLVTGLFGWLSRGSMRSDKSFAVLGADFVERNHLNRYALGSSVSLICSKRALIIPPKNKKPVRIMDLPDIGQATVVRVQIVTKDIPNGGARDDGGNVKFCMSQVRMIVKPAEQADSLTGKGQTVWPIGLLENGKLTLKDLSETVAYARKDFRTDGTVWVDFVFKVKDGLTGVLLEFKQNALAELPPPVQGSQETEQALNSEAKEKN